MFFFYCLMVSLFGVLKLYSLFEFFCLFVFIFFMIVMVIVIFFIVYICSYWFIFLKRFDFYLLYYEYLLKWFIFILNIS